MAITEPTQDQAPNAAPPVSAPRDRRERAERLECIAATYADLMVGETLVVDGYGARLAVQHGCLLVADGLGEHRRWRIVTKADVAKRGGPRRVLVLGVGSLTTPAIRWCAETGVALVVADRDGTTLMAGTPALAPVHGALRRAQALAPLRPEGPELVRWLLGLRLADQARILGCTIGDTDAAAMVAQLAQLVDGAGTVSEAMMAEGQAAAVYWTCWEDVALTWTRRDAGRIPSHWWRFGPRTSPLSLNARHAVTPGMALLNYGYALAESEAVLVALALGLDPAMGLAHAERPSRPALALDLMEAARHVVEDTVLTLAARPLRKADFAQLGSGEVRIMAPLSHELAKVLLPALRAVLAPVAEHVASVLGTVSLDPQGPRSRRPGTTTPLSRAHKLPSSTPASRHKAPSLAPACHGCGAALGRGKWCPKCLPEQRRAASVAWTTARRAKLAPAWAELGPKLAQCTLERIMAATGCAQSTAWRWRTGVVMPLPEHWPALRALVAGEDADGAASPSTTAERHHPAHHDRLAGDLAQDFEPLRRALRARGTSPEEVAAVTSLPLVRARAVVAGTLVPGRRHWGALEGLARS